METIGRQGNEWLAIDDIVCGKCRKMSSMSFDAVDVRIHATVIFEVAVPVHLDEAAVVSALCAGRT